MAKRYLGAGRDLGVDPSAATGGATKQYVDQWKPLTNILTAPTAAITSTTLVAGPQVTIPAAGTYYFRGDLGLVNVSSASLVTAIQMTGTMTTSAYRFWAQSYSVTALAQNVSTNSSGTTLITTGVQLFDLGASVVQQGCSISGTFTCTVAGTFAISMERLSGTALSFTIRSGSNLYVARTA